ncbi:MAG: carboxypeptidase-like regulatory domain-containing protein [Prevotellaceae bacterium]|nr:carboxypeptidase-like regulatory domain-containing protein [Prevotellaceae bacterium]
MFHKHNVGRLTATACLLLFSLFAEAQRISHKFSGVTLGEALTFIAQQARDYKVNFVEDGLDEFLVETYVKRSYAPEAIDQVIGNYPVEMTVDGRNIYVERMHRDFDSVSGTLADRQGQPVEYANVWLLSPQDSTILTGGVSDTCGSFNIPCRKDSFLLSVVAVGFAPLVRHARLGDIGTIPLERNAIMLEELDVGAPSVERLGDRDVIHITDEMRQGAANTGELIGKLPGFRYDRSRRKLTYRGQTNVMVLVDSLEKDVEYVTSMHHLRWSKMDIIPFPKGRYEGYNVLVNLHSASNYQGYDNSGFGLSDLMFGGHNMKGQALGEGDWGERLTYTLNTWTFSFDYKGKFSQMEDQIISESSFQHNDYVENVLANADGSRNSRQYARNHALTSSLDHQFNARSSVSFTYTLDWISCDSITRQTIERADLLGNITDTVGVNSASGRRGYRHTLTASYRGGTGEWNYTADLEYARESSDEDYSLGRTRGFLTADDRHNQADRTEARAELNRHFASDKLYVALGYENLWLRYAQLRQLSRESLTDYQLKQNTARAHIAYDVSRKTAVTASLSVTTNHSLSSGLSDRYLTWRGSFALSHSTRKGNWYHLVYTSSTQNPQLAQVTSHGILTDTLRLVAGNPLLRSSVSHTVQLDYSGRRGLGIWLRDTQSPRSFTRITSLTQGQQGCYALTTAQDQRLNSFETGASYSKWLSRFHFYCELLYLRECGKYRLDGEMQSHTVSHLETNWFASWDMRKVAKTRFTLAYNNDRLQSAWAQGTAKQHYDQLWAELSKSYLHGKVNVSILYVTPLHIVSGYNKTLWESPALTERLSQISLGRRTGNSLRLKLSYQLSGGRIASGKPNIRR